MKKFSLAVLAAIVLSACTASTYSNRGNATILSSKNISKDVVELTVRKDDGEIVTMTRQYDSHAAVGARVDTSSENAQEDEGLKTITRYNFK